MTDATSGQPQKAIRRRAPTRKSVLIADKIADYVIRVGGIAVIVAVAAIMLFLVEVVLPLFSGGEVVSRSERTREPFSGRVLELQLDEYMNLALSVGDSGEISAFHLPTGRLLNLPALDLGGARLTAFAGAGTGGDVALGFADGSVRFGKLRVVAQVIAADSLPAGLQDLGNGDLSDGSAIYQPLNPQQVRKLTVVSTLDAAQNIASGKAIVALDYRLSGTVERPSRSVASVDTDGAVRLSTATSRINLLTRQTVNTASTVDLPRLPANLTPVRILITEKADQVYLADRQGVVVRYDVRDPKAPQIAEQADLVAGDAELTLFDFLNGERSLIVGTSGGAVDVYFRLQRAGSRTGDGYQLVKAHALEPQAAAITHFATSQRAKTFVTADRSGAIWYRHSTSEQTLLKLGPGESSFRIAALALAPRDDGIVAVAEDGRFVRWDIDVPHPETTLSAIFGKIWYEGYGEPVYTWQSSSGTDTFEPKFSLVPLIFGTIKATVFCLLFAVPIALAAAIFTSEFVHRDIRGIVKPTMEMMASLPSVVLGFIAALILAPIVENAIVAVILAFATIPLGLFMGAYLWQLLPQTAQIRWGGVPKLALILVCVLLSGWIAFLLGPLLERLFFAGDFKAWASGRVGSDVPILTLLLLPVAYILVASAFDRTWRSALGRLPRGSAGAATPLAELARWIVMLIAGVLLAFVVAVTCNWLGLHLRGGLVGTYVQRNTLVVSFAMAFAVIPIVYTIAEDALNAVPEHLRAASLACGATPWQTAIKIILPTAMSGVFAAIMVGMGRAVGETMIVVMAAGNTPVLDWNLFSGLRALSANIAVELPEAVKDSTLYRMLFLAALTLFAMTFVINTMAELVRQRFRKRAAQL